MKPELTKKMNEAYGEKCRGEKRLILGEMSYILGFFYRMKGGKRKDLVTTIDFDFSQVIFGPYVFA